MKRDGNPKDWRAIYQRVRAEIDPARWYTTPEVSALLGVLPSTIDMYVCKDELPSLKRDKVRKFRGRDVVAFLREKAYFAPRPKAA